MKKCDLTITTTIDGTESIFTTEGKMEISSAFPKLCYCEDGAFVRIVFYAEGAKIERTGDYSLKLVLERGKVCAGVLGFGGNEGGISTLAHKVGYSIGKESLMALLQYDLLTSGEPQETSVRISAKLKE